MSTDPKPTDSDAELGITFTEKQAPTPDSREGGLKMPTTPTVEEVVKDTEATRQSGVFNVSEAFNAKHDLGTIVTDKKKRRTSFTDNMSSAWNEWWGHAKKAAKPAIETLAKPKVEEPKVSKVETRVEVVESTATHASMAPQDDHKVVFEKIKTFKRDVERVTGTPFTIKEEKKAEPSWTHTIDPKKIEKPVPPPAPKPIPRPIAPPDLRPSMVAPVVEKRIQKNIDEYARKPEEKKVEAPRKTTSPTQIAYMHIPGTVERKDRPQAVPAHIAPVIQVQKEIPVADVATPVPPKEVVGYVARAEVKQAAELAKHPIEAPIPPEFSPITPSQREAPQEEEAAFHGEVSSQESAKQSENTSANRVYLTPPEPLISQKLILSLLSGGALVALTTVFVVLLSKNNEPDTVTERETLEIETFFDVEIQSAIPIAGSSNDFFAAFLGALDTAEGNFVQLYPTAGEGDELHAATSEEFFVQLGIDIPEKMRRALDDTIMIGGVRTSSLEPFVVIRSYNFDALFAGMLEWEPRLRNSFSPLFDSSYVETDIFTDAVISNRPARVLEDVRGEEVLLYTIVGKDTVVISASRDALERVIDEL